jgi:hypothetical protein
MDKYQRLADDRSERELKLMECSIAVLLLTVRGVDYAAGLPKAAKNVAHRLQLGEDGCKSLRRKQEALPHDVILDAALVHGRGGRPRSEPYPRASQAVGEEIPRKIQLVNAGQMAGNFIAVKNCGHAQASRSQ